MLCVCVGCTSTNSLGSIKDDSLDLERLSEIIDEKIAEKEWQSEVLQEALPFEAAQDLYGISASQYDAVLIRRSLLPAACEEIVVVHAQEGQQDCIMQQLQAYQQQRIDEYALFPHQQAMMEKGQVWQNGNYVFFVCSQDGANVIQYISSLE